MNAKVTHPTLGEFERDINSCTPRGMLSFKDKRKNGFRIKTFLDQEMDNAELKNLMERLARFYPNFILEKSGQKEVRTTIDREGHSFYFDDMIFVAFFRTEEEGS